MQRCRTNCASRPAVTAILFRRKDARALYLAGALVGVCLPMAISAQDAAPWRLSVSDASQATLVEIELPEAGRWCLVWNHSVQGFSVSDCFELKGGQLMLDSTHTPDFAAGLGHMSGRGTLESDDSHGYRIVDMQVPIPDNYLRLRVGDPSVNHRIKAGERLVSLSHLAPNTLVEIRVQPTGDTGNQLQ